MIRTARLLFALLLLLGGISARAAEKTETVTIDSVAYKVPPRWAGKKLDSSLVADPKKLVRLPEELSFENSRIYVTRATREAFVKMAAAAKKDSINLIADSGYRSASFQRKIYRKRMADGATFEQVARFVAPPGYSQHQTGRALDLVPSEARFAHTKIYKWLKKHAGEFGFVESMPEPPKGSGQGYWEAWHWYFEGK